MNVNFFRIIVKVLLYINGITAIGGGLILIIEPKGSILQLSVNLLNGSPFQNYLIPGIILFFFNGMLSLLTLFYTVKKKNFYPYMIIMQGIVLFAWLSTQIILLKYFFASLHITYFSITLALITFGIILLNKNLKGNKKMKALTSLFLILSSFIIISCGDNNTVNQTNDPQPIYSHSLIELSGPGLQEYHDTIPLTFENTDSVYAEFWSETNIDTTDYVLVSVAIYDTAAAGGTYFSNFFTENTVDLNRVHGFSFKLVNSTIKLEISILKGSIDNKYLRLRNFNIYKK